MKAKEKPASLAGLTGSFESTLSPHITVPRQQAQGARFVVFTTKASGAHVVFGMYETRAEAAAVTARPIEVGGNARTIEVAS